jgi:hypothetical protein
MNLERSHSIVRRPKGWREGHPKAGMCLCDVVW